MLQVSPRGEDSYRLSTFMESYKHAVTGEHLLDMRNAPVLFLNDLERNSGYSSWLPSMHALFTMGPPGALRHIRKNLFNVVFVVDPSQSTSIEMLKLAEIIIMKKIPIRCVSICNSCVSVHLLSFDENKTRALSSFCFR